MSTPPPLLTQWIAEGCPPTSTFVLGAIAESIAALGDPPQGSEPQWPAPIAEAIRLRNASGQLGAINWEWFAAFEVTGTPRHPSATRLLGRLLVHLADRAAYIAAVKRLAALL